MPKSELLNQILSDYATRSPTQAEPAAAAVADFCAYACDWLAHNPPVGVGYAASSLMLRLSDGRELSLFDADEQFAPPPAGSSVSITGGGGNRVRVGDHTPPDRSLPITRS